jgi:hypothetical protein
MNIAANTTGFFRYLIRNRKDVEPGIFIDDLAWDYQTLPANTSNREHSGTVNAIFRMESPGRFGILFQSDINSGTGNPVFQASRINITRIVP